MQDYLSRRLDEFYQIFAKQKDEEIRNRCAVLRINPDDTDDLKRNLVRIKQGGYTHYYYGHDINTRKRIISYADEPEITIEGCKITAIFTHY